MALDQATTASSAQVAASGAEPFHRTGPAMRGSTAVIDQVAALDSRRTPQPA